MSQDIDTLNPTLFLPTVLALAMILLVSGLLWLSQPGRVAGLLAEAAPAESDTAAAETTSASTQSTAGDADHGAQLFSQTCAACHGQAAQGVAGLGKDLTTSQFVAESSDAALVDFIKRGRPPGDPLNTTGVDMPPKGGNPTLTEADIQDIVAYLNNLNP